MTLPQYGYRWLNLVLGPVLFLSILLFWKSETLTSSQIGALALLVWMAGWWIFESVPLYVTALLPIPAIPLLTQIPLSEVTHSYGDPIIFLFLGGFVIALAIENVGLHHWFASHMLHFFGSKPRHQLLALMCTAAFLSLWISNTATTLMLLPLMLATADCLQLTKKAQAIFVVSLAYSASIGGMGTLVGTPPNLIFAKFSEQLVGVPISFMTWLLIGIPFVICFLGIVGFYFCCLLTEKGAGSPRVTEHAKIPRLNFKQKLVLGIFLLTVANWIFKLDIPLGRWTLPGITTLLGLSSPLDDGAIAMIGALLLFLIPTSQDGKDRVMTWSDTVRIPWGVLLLFGGGIALSMSIKETGLMEVLGKGFGIFSGMPLWVLIFMVCFVTTFLTEVSSNTAVAQVILPVLAAGAVHLQVHPLMLMIPATLSASCAFMLPVATPPNSVVFATGKVPAATMMKLGLVLNLIGAVFMTVYVYFHPVVAQWKP